MWQITFSTNWKQLLMYINGHLHKSITLGFYTSIFLQEHVQLDPLPFLEFGYYVDFSNEAW